MKFSSLVFFMTNLHSNLSFFVPHQLLILLWFLSGHDKEIPSISRDSSEIVSMLSNCEVIFFFQSITLNLQVDHHFFLQSRYQG